MKNLSQSTAIRKTPVTGITVHLLKIRGYVLV